MKTRRSVRRLLPSTPALTIGLALAFAFLSPAGKVSFASAQVTSPAGSYGILVNQWRDANSNNVSALLGVLNFDGAGNITGTYTFLSSKANTPANGTWTGTYSGNPDGSNTVNLTADAGATLTVEVTVTDGGTGLQLLVTGGSLPKPGQVITGIGRIQSAQGTMPAGSYGLLLNQWPDANNGPQGILGVFSLDGAGNATGAATVTGSGIGNVPLPVTFVGTYSVNPDGTGSITLNVNLGITITFSTVVTDGGAGILMLQTAESDGLSAVTSGTARMQ